MAQFLVREIKAAGKKETLEKKDADYHFYEGKVASARSFCRNLLPEVGVLIPIINEADTTAMEADEAIFG